MYEYEAEVDRVIDGDTIDFMVDLGFNVHIKIRTRLLGVNTPERGHEDFALATETCWPTTVLHREKKGLLLVVKKPLLYFFIIFPITIVSDFFIT